MCLRVKFDVPNTSCELETNRGKHIWDVTGLRKTKDKEKM